MAHQIHASPVLPEGLNLGAQTVCHATHLRQATRRITLLYDALLAPTGLRSTQRSIMMQIARSQPVRMSDLASILVIDRSAVSQNLKPLEREGWVHVAADPADKRGRLVTLSPAGLDKLLETQPLWEQAQASFEQGYGSAKAQKLRKALVQVVTCSYEGDVAE